MDLAKKRVYSSYTLETRPPPVGITLLPGQGGFQDIVPTGLTRLGQRALLRPVVTVDSAAGADACQGVIASAEIFDRLTGGTWSQSNPGPQQ